MMDRHLAADESELFREIRASSRRVEGQFIANGPSEELEMRVPMGSLFSTHGTTRAGPPADNHAAGPTRPIGADLPAEPRDHPRPPTHFLPMTFSPQPATSSSRSVNCHRVAKIGQLGRDSSATLRACQLKRFQHTSRTSAKK